MIERCSDCKNDFLTESDPYVVINTSRGLRLTCLSCYSKTPEQVIKDLESKLKIAVEALEIMITMGCDCGRQYIGSELQIYKCIPHAALAKIRGEASDIEK